MTARDFLGARPTQVLTLSELRAIAVDAYVYGYPAVLMDVSRRMSIDDADSPGPARLNHFAHQRRLPDHTCRDFTYATTDTLYSVACLDLRAEPIVLSVPAMAGRYHLFQLVDAWTNVFAAPGSASADDAGDYALIPPGWSGSLPLEMEPVQTPSKTVWAIGRIHTIGALDYPSVHALQDRCQLTALSDWQGSARLVLEGGLSSRISPASLLHGCAERVARLDARTFFNRLAALMAANPPPPEDFDIVDRLGRIGLRPGYLFVPEALGVRAPRVLSEAIRTAQQMIAACPRLRGWRVNGWDVHLRIGNCRTDYLLRASIARTRLGLGVPEDSVDVHTEVDSDGHPLDGARTYQLRFPPGHLPPVDVLWSLTAYDADQFLVSNPIRRYALSGRDPLELDPDGALTITLQRAEPTGERITNWLPIPDGPFSLILRLYGPGAPLFEGTWTPPLVRRSDDAQIH
jgi:DNA sulfur modification protein DndE